MKYIRTEDEIIYVGDLFKDKEGNYCKSKVVYGSVANYTVDIVEVGAEYIVKEANTIEELCDVFIFKDTCSNEWHIVDESSGISMLGASLFSDTLKGYIETEKGLIPVVKMNEKGDIELL